MINLLGFFRPGLGELLVILLIVLVVFGASRLPKVARSMGEAIKEFRKSVRSDETEKKETPSNNNTENP